MKYDELNFLQRPAFLTWLVLGVLAAEIGVAGTRLIEQMRSGPPP